MKNTMKKVLCTLLVMVLCLTSAPLSGFMELDLPKFADWFSAKANAVNYQEYFDSGLVDPSTQVILKFDLNGGTLKDGAYIYDDAKQGFVYVDGEDVPNPYIMLPKDHTVQIEGQFVTLPYLNPPQGYRVDGWYCYADGYTYPAGGIYRIPQGTAGNVIEFYASFVLEDPNYVDPKDKHTEGKYTYTLTDDKATIIDVDQSISGDVVIPSTLGGYPVTAIGYGAFAECIYITGVTVPEGVTLIGERAFMECVNLTKISLPDTLNVIDGFAFGYCISLQTIIVPDTVNYIGNGAFAGCFLLKEFNVPENVERFFAGTFMYCFSLEKLIVNNVQTNFEEYYICCTDYKLVNITVDEFVEKGKEWFELLASGNSEAADELSNEIIENHLIFTESVELLKNVTIYSYDPSTAKTYAEENGIPFKNISELEGTRTDGYYTYTVTDGYATITDVDKSISGDVVIPSTLGGYPVVAIGDEAFAYCYDITSVTVPEGVTVLEDSAFACNFKLKEINLPESLEQIGNGCFELNISLQEITIPDNVKTIEDHAFDKCIKLESITIPETVTTLGDYAIMDCLLLNKIIIKNPALKLGEYVYVLTIQPIGVTREAWAEVYFRYATTDEISWEEIESITKDIETEEDLIYYATIYSHDPSTAKTYAEENEIPFKNISELEESHTCTFGEWFTETEPTVFDEGVSKRVCDCGLFETKPIAKLESAVTKDETTNIEITYTEENFETEVSLIVSEEEINANIAFGDEFENYKAYDISLVADGEKVQPNGYVTVKLPIPEGFNADTTAVYYVAPDGTKTKLESRAENGYVIFETNHFSEYVLVDENSKIEPPHEHLHIASITKEATCTEDGVKTFTCSCNDSYTETIKATGHDFDGSKCKNCEYDKANDCSCNCHKGGFMGFFWKIINFFNKLFKNNQYCACGAKHW